MSEENRTKLAVMRHERSCKAMSANINSRHAFMVIEIMMAMLFMCVTAVMIAQYQGRIMHTIQLARDTARATELASSLLEDLLCKEQDMSSATYAIDRFTIVKECRESTGTFAERQLSLQFLKTIADVSVKVSWTDSQRVPHTVIVYSTIAVKKV